MRRSLRVVVAGRCRAGAPVASQHINEVLAYLVMKALLVADDLERHELVRLPVEALHTSAYVSIRQHTL